MDFRQSPNSFSCVPSYPCILKLCWLVWMSDKSFPKSTTLSRSTGIWHYHKSLTTKWCIFQPQDLIQTNINETLGSTVIKSVSVWPLHQPTVMSYNNHVSHDVAWFSTLWHIQTNSDILCSTVVHKKSVPDSSQSGLCTPAITTATTLWRHFQPPPTTDEGVTFTNLLHSRW